MCKIIFLSLLLIFSGCAREQLTVSVASSLADVMTEICDDYGNVSLNFGGSGTLKIQIDNGADVDVFISADMSHAIDNSDVLASNKLVLISNNPQNTFDDFMKNTNALIGIGNPDIVPAGWFASQIIDLYDIVNPLNLATEVRQVLSWVSGGEIEYGFVYKTDAMTDESVHIIKVFDECDDILYPIILLNDDEKTIEFVEFLKKQSKTLEKYGFTVEN